MTRIVLCLLMFVGCGETCAERDQRLDCYYARKDCMEVCKEHVTTASAKWFSSATAPQPIVVEAVNSPDNKVKCLQFCFDEHRHCMGETRD